MIGRLLKTVKSRKSSSWYDPAEQSDGNLVVGKTQSGKTHVGRNKEDVEVKPRSLRVGDVVSAESAVRISEGETLTSLNVGTVVNVNKEKKTFTVSKSEDDREVELSFHESRVFRLFHDKNFSKQTNDDAGL